jgi:acyl-CoA synthetase
MTSAGGQSNWILPRGIPPEIATAREEQRQHWRQQGLYSSLTVFEELELAVEKRPECCITYIVRESDSAPGAEMVLNLVELRRRALALAAGLSDLGLCPGDVIGVQLPNWPEAIIAYYAASALGLTILTIVDIYASTELDFILTESQARALIVADSWRHLGFRQRIGKVHSSSLEHLIVARGEPAADIVTWEELEKPGAQLEVTFPQPDPADPVLVLYTSGSTSHPKGVVHSHETLLAEVRLSPLAPKADGSFKSLQVSPPGHISGLLALLRSILFVGDAVILDGWDAETAKRAVEEHDLTSSAGLFFMQALLEQFERSGNSIPKMDWVVGGSAVPPALVEKADSFGWRAFRSYGSSEHPTLTGSTHAAPLRERSQTDGRPCRGSEVRILDGDGQEVPLGGEGEIVCRGPEQFLGYVAPHLNADAFVSGGWLRTGDIGRIDADGNLIVTGRIKDIIIRGGENISATEVEELLRRHPDIVDAAVVPYPDKRYGERVAAFVVPGSDHPIDIEGIAGFFQEVGVAKQKVPERLGILSELPRTVAGKVDKQQLRTLAEEPEFVQDGVA